MGIFDIFTKSANNKQTPIEVSQSTFLRSLTAIAETQSIDADSILQNATAFAAIDTIAKTVAQQPFQVMQDGSIDNNAFPFGILSRPNPDLSDYEAKYQICVDLMTHGRAFIETRKSQGITRSWRLVPPRMIKVSRNSIGRTVLELDNIGAQGIRYKIENVDIRNVTMIRDITSSQVPQGISRVELARRLVALDNAIDRFGNNLFNRGLQIGGHVIVLPEILKPDQAKTIIDSLKEQYAGIDNPESGGTPVLQGGIDIKPIAPIKPTDADMSSLKQRTMSQIAGVFGVPAALIELNNGNANYNNVQQRYAGFYRDTIGPLSRNITSKLDRAFELPPNVNIRLDSTELLKGDMTSLTNVAVSNYRNGVWTLNEAREYTGQESVTDGDEFMDLTMPSNTTGTSGGTDEEN